MRGDGIPHRARHGADGVERGRQRQRALGRHQPGGALETHDPVQRGRNADRAAGVGAQADEGRPGGDRHGGPGGRTARDARRGRIARVGRRAVVRVDAHAGKGEFRHVGAARQHAARGAQSRHSHGIGLGGRRMRKHHGTRRGRLPFDVEQVLGGEGEPGEPALRRRTGGPLAGFVEQRAGEHVAAGRGLGDADGALHFGACISATCQKIQTGGVEVVHGWAARARTARFRGGQGERAREGRAILFGFR